MTEQNEQTEEQQEEQEETSELEEEQGEEQEEKEEQEVISVIPSPPPTLGRVAESEVTYARIGVALGMADHRWEQYGHLLAPVVFKDRYGKLDARSGYKLWMYKDPNEENATFSERRLLRDSQTFIPHEEVSAALNNLFYQQLHDTSNNTRDWKITQHFSHHDETCHWEILTDCYQAIKGSYTEQAGEEDGVFLGAVVRNGLGTNVALGVDLFTYRPFCSNGAIARGKDLGSFAINHVGKVERMADAFKKGIAEVFARVEQMVEYYRAATRVTLNQKVVDLIISRVRPADKYLPDYIEVDESVRKLKEAAKKDNNVVIPDKPEYRLTQAGKDVTLWENFNDFTSELWKSPTLSYQWTGYYEGNLHSAMVKSIDSRIATAIAQ